MDAIPSNLCTLVEQLEDARQFHDGAARQSDGVYHEQHCARSLAYARMLSEIREWESRVRLSEGRRCTDLDPSPPLHDDSYAALLERVYLIHSSVRPVGRTMQIPAGALLDVPVATGRCVGEPMHC